MPEEIYARGDWIVHAYYGVGQVIGRDNKTLDGEKQTFLRVKTLTSEYFLPVKKWDAPHIRRVSSQYQFRKALSILRNLPEPLDTDHKVRSKQISIAATDISLYTKARIIRDLNGRKKAGKLNASESEAFDKFINQFITEWSVQTEKDNDFLREKLDKALLMSYEKLVNEKDDSWLEKIRKGVQARRNPDIIPKKPLPNGSK